MVGARGKVPSGPLRDAQRGGLDGDPRRPRRLRPAPAHGGVHAAEGGQVVSCEPVSVSLVLFVDVGIRNENRGATRGERLL